MLQLPDYIWSEEYQTTLLSEHFKAFDSLRNKSFFIGEMIWNFADFKTDQCKYDPNKNYFHSQIYPEETPRTLRKSMCVVPALRKNEWRG